MNSDVPIDFWNASKLQITFYNSIDIRYDNIRLVLLETNYTIFTKTGINYNDQIIALFDHQRELYYERNTIIR